MASSPRLSKSLLGVVIRRVLLAALSSTEYRTISEDFVHVAVVIRVMCYRISTYAAGTRAQSSSYPGRGWTYIVLTYIWRFSRLYAIGGEPSFCQMKIRCYRGPVSLVRQQ